jgi:hypothetical protein
MSMEQRGATIEELKQELLILEAFRETGRARQLRAIIDRELARVEREKVSNE